MRRRSAVIAVVMIGMLLSQTYPAFSAKTVSATTVRVAYHRGDESNLTPYTYVSGDGYFLMTLIYDTLFWMDPQGRPQPWLVKSFETSSDGRQLTLRLHENIKWHDGQPLTADDVKFTIEFMQKFRHARFSAPLKPVASIVVLDPLTLMITLSQPSPTFIPAALADVPIIPKHLWGNVTENPNKKPEVLKKFNLPDLPPGSGPYILVEHIPDQLYRLKANDAYFKGRPALDEIVIPIVTDASASFLALKAGQVDALSRSLSPELVKDFEQTPGIKILRGVGLATTQLQLNDERYPFSIKEFRQAVALSLDLDAIIKTVMLGFATKGSPGFLHPIWPGANTALKYEFNVSKAKALLDGLGFKPGPDGVRITSNGTRLEFSLLAQSNDPLRIRTAELIGNALKEVGIEVNVKVLEEESARTFIWPGFDVSKGRNFDMAMWGWTAPVHRRGDALPRLFNSDPSVGTLNVGGYRNPAFDALANQQLSETDPTKSTELLFKMQAVIAEDVPTIVLFYPDPVFAFRPEVYQGWIYVPTSGTILDKLSFLGAAAPPPVPQQGIDYTILALAGGAATAVIIGVLVALRYGRKHRSTSLVHSRVKKL